MALTADFLAPERVVYLKGKTKREALLELVDAIAQAPEVGDKEQLQLAVLEREEIMSTAIGVEVAVPHVKLSSISSFVLAVGISRDGVDFDSTDGKPIRIVVMITGPADQHESYLKILSDVALLLRDEEVRAKIINAQTAAEVIETFAG
jgi:PTS system nitrogen regulatory IIA component